MILQGSPSWFLIRIEIHDTRINNSYFKFEHRQKIPLSNYWIINDFKFFKISVFTSKSFNSGTNAKVYIIIFDFFKNTDSRNHLCVDKIVKNKNYFQVKYYQKNPKQIRILLNADSRDEFYVQLDEFGSPTKIKYRIEYM